MPNDISTTVRIKVQDFNDPTVKDYSNNFFKIRGSFTVTSPNGNSNVSLTDRWVTNEINRNITWTSNGTMANVKIQYSNDNFVSDFHDIALSTANDGSHNWVIPDIVQKDINGKYTGPNMIKVRVSDVNDSGFMMIRIMF